MRRNYKIKNKKSVSIIGIKIPIIVFIAGLILAIFTVFFTIQTVTSSAKLVYLENEELQLIKKNQELNNILIGSSSLTSLAKNAQELGFIKPTQTFYGEQEKEVAKLP